MIPLLSLLDLVIIMGLVFPVAFLVLFVAWAVMSFVLTPKVAKIITRASVSHSSIALIWQANHIIKVVLAKVMSEGYIVTKGTRKQKSMRIPIARPVYQAPADPDLDKKEIKRYERDNDDLRRMEKEALRVSMFEGCRVPVFAVYSGIALAINPETMVSLESENDFRKVWSGAFSEEQLATMPTSSIPTMANGGTSIRQKIKEVLVRVLLPINPDVVKKHLSKLVDQTTIDGIYQDGWQEGYEEGKAQKNEKMFLYMILLMIACGIAIMLLIRFS